MGGRKRTKKAEGPPRFCGIDPGKEGFICVVDERCAIRAMWRIPYLDNRIDYVALAKMFKALRAARVRLIILEHQQAFHKEGPVGAFSNGASFGALCALLAIIGVSYEIKKPDVWKRDAGIPVPSVPKAVLPEKPSTKPAIKKWNAECKKIRAKRGREVKKRRKALSCAKAQALQPEYDFRLSTRAKGPHDGKCEAFLLAREAWKQARRIRDADGYY